MSDPIRLDKRVAQLFGCSRGQAQLAIEAGAVQVDAQVVERPQTLVSDQQAIVLASDPIRAPAPATFLLHKPVGVTAEAASALLADTTRSPLETSEGRLLQKQLRSLQAPLPLEAEASGLLVLSQDPRVLRRLDASAFPIEQEFVLEVEGEIHPYGLRRLALGLQCGGERFPACKASWQSERRLRIALKTVRPAPLRDMCAEVGLQVSAIRRLRIGRVPLGKLAAGQWCHLPRDLRF
ncbi:RNA pseudouridine synthase [Xanthomonas maliensis]|uniref:RNA pseudouridine synthase n=1 Tax=Xanthomonas maliensis TaxID=1321368 RepID=UPI00039FDF4E|nr:RNA pseudouridine synthase [Xanthomonas maliensis]KAB7772246.1 RNA-binding protein [Xanthomonas maliensis]